MSARPETIASYIEQLADSELTAYLRGLDEIIATARHVQNAPGAAWHNLLRGVAEADQRRRAGAVLALPDVEMALYQAARDLSDLTLGGLIGSYADVFNGATGLRSDHPAARLAGVCQIICELERERRRPAA